MSHDHDLGAFWRERWEKGQIGFHQDAPTPALLRHAERLGPPGRRVLVPLAGKSLDLVWLSARGDEVVGVELAERAVVSFWLERGVVPARRTEGPVERFTALPGTLPELRGRLELLRADVFDVGPEHAGTLDAVVDRAALVALPPDVRPRYARHVLGLLAPGARILLVTFEYDQAVMPGPPFAVLEPEIQALFGGACAIELLERSELGDDAKRFRDRGATWVHEAVWLLSVR